MSRLQKALGVGALVLALTTGCEKPESVPESVIGTVTLERGTMAQVVASDGALFGNESLKISEPTYVLQIQTPQGLYTASVKENYTKPLVALALAIEEGSRVRINKRILDYRFDEDKVGYLISHEITIENNQ